MQLDKDIEWFKSMGIKHVTGTCIGPIEGKEK